MDPLHLCIAVTPLSAYLALIASFHLARRPVVLTGFWDLAALAGGVSGMMAAGPLELFLPETAAFRFGPYVWLLMFALYGLAVALLLLSLRPRLVVYNLSLAELRPVLSQVIERIDDQSRWASDSVVLPRQGVHLHLDGPSTKRIVQLVASGGHQNQRGWARLEDALKSALRGFDVGPSRRGIVLLLTACLLIALVAVSAWNDQEAVASAWNEMLRF